MSAAFTPRVPSVSGSGGKAVRLRRVASPACPYRRPVSKRCRSFSPNAGWISSAARSVVAGAGKLFSIFRSDSGSSCESDSSSSSESSTDKGDGYRDDHRWATQYDKEVECFSKENVIIPVANEELAKDTQQISKAHQSEIKCTIEQLLLQETFTWEECSRLTKILQSRVVDNSTIVEDKNPERKCPSDQIRLAAAGSPETQQMLVGTSNAIMEARKWFQEKNIDRSSKPNTYHGHCSLPTDMISYDAQVGSPVHVAQSYMRSRPLWASPFWINYDFKCASVGLNHHEASHVMADNAVCSMKMKRSTLESGLYSALSEARRTHLKLDKDVWWPVESSTRLLQEHGKILPTADDVAGLAGVVHSDTIQAVKSGNESGGFPNSFQHGTYLSEGDGQAQDLSDTTVVASHPNILEQAANHISETKVHKFTSLETEKVLADTQPSEENVGGASISHEPPLHKNGDFSAGINIISGTSVEQIIQSVACNEAASPTSHLLTCSQAGKNPSDHICDQVNCQAQKENEVTEKADGKAKIGFAGAVGLEPEQMSNSRDNQNLNSMMQGDLGAGKSQISTKITARQRNSSIRADNCSHMSKSRKPVKVRPGISRGGGGYHRRGRGKEE